MQVLKPVGRNAGALKYDFLSALMAYGLAQDKTVQRRVMRLMALITARYNWQRNELSTGQVEIARLWSVDQRTVKREFAQLRNMGWLVLKSQGVRGRVSVYKLDLGLIIGHTQPYWSHIGPDFEDRMREQHSPQTVQNPTPSNVVSINRSSTQALEGEGIWPAAMRRLAGTDPNRFQAWYARLVDGGRDGGTVTIMAPSAFVADYLRQHLADDLLLAFRLEDPSISLLKVEIAS